jgi:hypothetical protein
MGLLGVGVGVDEVVLGVELVGLTEEAKVVGNPVDEVAE